jgi:hypothetical protein
VFLRHHEAPKSPKIYGFAIEPAEKIGAILDFLVTLGLITSKTPKKSLNDSADAPARDFMEKNGSSNNHNGMVTCHDLQCLQL